MVSFLCKTTQPNGTKLGTNDPRNVRFKFIQMKLILRGERLASTRPKVEFSEFNIKNCLLISSNRNAAIQFIPPVKMSACHNRNRNFFK